METFPNILKFPNLRVAQVVTTLVDGIIYFIEVQMNNMHLFIPYGKLTETCHQLSETIELTTRTFMPNNT